MSEERALELFAMCYNGGDFSPVIRRLHKRCTLEWYDFFYRQEGRDRVEQMLHWREAKLNAQTPRNRAHHGFEMVKHDVLGMQPQACIVLTDSTDREVLGIVRIRCSLFRIKTIYVGNPEYHTYTRGKYIETEKPGRGKAEHTHG